MRNERSGRDQNYRVRPKSALELGRITNNWAPEVWLQTTREIRTGAASEAYVVLSALVPYWVSQVFLQRVSDESLFLKPHWGGVMEGGGRGRDGG